MNTLINSLESKYLRKIIKDPEYCLKRTDQMESKIYQWKSYYNKATTNTERAYCQKMIRMYLKRFIYYINK